MRSSVAHAVSIIFAPIYAYACDVAAAAAVREFAECVRACPGDHTAIIIIIATTITRVSVCAHDEHSRWRSHGTNSRAHACAFIRARPIVCPIKLPQVMTIFLRARASCIIWSRCMCVCVYETHALRSQTSHSTPRTENRSATALSTCHNVYSHLLSRTHGPSRARRTCNGGAAERWSNGAMHPPAPVPMSGR